MSHGPALPASVFCHHPCTAEPSLTVPARTAAPEEPRRHSSAAVEEARKGAMLASVKT
jgi:hypothetical protein